MSQGPIFEKAPILAGLHGIDRDFSLPIEVKAPAISFRERRTAKTGLPFREKPLPLFFQARLWYLLPQNMGTKNNVIRRVSVGGLAQLLKMCICNGGRISRCRRNHGCLRRTILSNFYEGVVIVCCVHAFVHILEADRSFCQVTHVVGRPSYVQVYGRAWTPGRRAERQRWMAIQATTIRRIAQFGSASAREDYGSVRDG